MRRSALAAMCILALSACASPGDPGIAMERRVADLAFGAPAPRPAGTSLPPPPLITAAPRPDPAGPIVIPPLVTPRCPAAPATTFPAEEAPIRPTGDPGTGAYRWIYRGTQVLEGSPTRQPLARFGRRDVTAATDLLGRPTHQTRELDPALDSNDLLTQRFVSQDDGLYLTAMERAAPTGTNTFAPLSPVLYLPFPVTIDATFRSLAIDPMSRQALEHTATVKGRARVDACGQLIEGWAVEAFQIFTQAGGVQVSRSYDYVVATQRGGLIVSESIEAPCASDEGRCDPPGTLRYRASIGQLDPEPPSGA